MADNVSTPQHCPGYADFKNLKALVCKCSKCGKEKEIFSDEFDRPHTCNGCGEAINFDECEVTGEGKSVSPR
jgi:CO dehydrogenase/acetyl-CoA synthase beta subunit